MCCVLVTRLEVLFTKTCIIVITGEIASVATRDGMNMNELLFGVVTQSGGRKTDTLVLAKEVSGGEVHYIECSVNEHKPLHVGQATLKEQSRKVVRINRSILSCTGSQKTALFIDARGFRGKIYGMRVIEDVYGVSAALGQVCLQSNKFEMTEFLSGPSLLTLFRYKVSINVVMYLSASLFVKPFNYLWILALLIFRLTWWSLGRMFY